MRPFYHLVTAVRKCGLVFTPKTCHHILLKKPCFALQRQPLHVPMFLLVSRTLVNKGQNLISSGRGNFVNWEKHSNECFQNFLESTASVEDFEHLESKLDEYKGKRNKTEFQIINLMYRNNEPELLMKYLDFVKRRRELSVVSLQLAISFLTPTHPDRGLQLIYDLERKISFEHHSILYLQTAIHNLLLTKDWQYGMELFYRHRHQLITDLNVHQRPHIEKTVFLVLVAVLKNSDVDLYIDVLKKNYIYFVNMSFYHATFMQWLQTGYISPDLYLEVLKQNFFGLNQLQVNDVRKELERLWGDSVKVRWSEMPVGSCCCPVCGERLITQQIMAEDTQQLMTSFTDQILNNPDTLPNEKLELRKFLRFLNHTGSFDVIVDMLNVLGGNQLKASWHIRHMRITQEMVANRLGVRKPKILFVTKGRQDIAELTLPQNCYFYSISHERVKGLDDVLVMLGALYSGPDAYYISGDAYRDHSRPLDRAVFLKFMRWKTARRMKVNQTEKEIIMPSSLASITQESEKGWHVLTYKSKGIQLTEERYHELGQDFLCIQKMANWRPDPAFAQISEELKRKLHFSKEASLIGIEM